MEIASGNPVSGQSGGFAAAGRPSSDGALIGSDFETFLKMLTAQMKHQDPLNPVDSTQFATQLATFSSVEQQVRTNELLTALGAQMGALSVSQLSGWVGMTARAEMPVHFDGEPVTISTRDVGLADRAELVVRNREGKEIQRLPVETGRQELEWAGVSASGAPLPAGVYHLTVESYAADELTSTDAVYVHARIVEARNEDGLPILVMDSGQEVESGDIVGLRQAQ
ncbi:flagellar hook capping FlgD N-terminal domain-containing protein [Roseovarius sp.]|uniref:flagellar hook capping FlgD N-terminal domain-containing protein n=1 Tax=Roseovarius sp. TaxID=1486281 RepID=UPI002607532C|nr:flagellar hook capping FlgD N-terminal domain-containing protein [Roseovarius sp.]MDM8164971.1 flagellar hook capping FlgD N-terminal domain-containing protein [Roseovarius sp.]